MGDFSNETIGYFITQPLLYFFYQRKDKSFSHATSVAIFNQIGAANKSEMIVVRWFKMQLQDSWL